jgi:pyruvate formate lyase activating enzyme
VTSQTCRTIEIIRGGSHDGPGLRTTVFLKGCSLNCRWCQNPEGIAFGQEVWWEARKCIGCKECVAACPAHALSADEGGLSLDRERCTQCGACVAACPARAMTFTGRDWSLDELLREVLKDRDYYRAFGGGVTVSGGEPLGQHACVAELFRRLREEKVHTALDTCGLASTEAFAAVLPHTDLVLFDIKLLDSDLHREFTGHGNERILANLQTVADHVRRKSGGPTALWIRTPLIPGATATAGNLTAIGRYIGEQLADVTQRWELCAFNGACNQKYEKLGQAWHYAGQPLMEQHAIATLREAALTGGFPREKLVVSGLVAKDGPSGR